MDTSSSGSMYRAGATEALAGKQGENTTYGRNVRLEQTNKTPPVQKTTANKIALQLRSSAQIPAPSLRRGSPPPSSKDGAAHTAPTNVNLNSGITPFRSAIVNAVMDFEATVEQAKSNFKSSPGSDKNVLLTSINNATAILLHAIEGAMIDAQETKNTQVVHSKITTNSKKIESGSSGPVAAASYCPLRLPTPMSDYRSAHLWPTNPGAPDTGQRVH